MQQQLTRTTVRLHPALKRATLKKALELDMTFQDFLTQALETYLQKEHQKKAKKILFKAKPLGSSLQSLTREDIYAD